jgi:hypothetical protein
MSRTMILRTIGVFAATVFGIASGIVAGALVPLDQASAVAAPTLNTARSPSIEVVAPSDNVIDWLAEVPERGRKAAPVRYASR